MNSTFKRSLANRHRKKGIATVYIALLLPLIIGIGAFSIDLSLLYARQTKAQTAADAAALAGAFQQAHFNSRQADDFARYYAAMPEHGAYVPGVRGAKVTIEYPAVNRDVTPNVVVPNWYRVSVERSEPTFFARIFGPTFASFNVGATATALYETLAELNINGGGTYGKAPGVVNLSVFGPEGNYNNGDCYSVTNLPDGKINPIYNNRGYDFTVNIASFKGSTAYVQLFDPDCYNADGSVNVNGAKALDEYRGSGEGTTGPQDATTTKYDLFDDNGTPYDLTDDRLIQSRSYGNTSTTDLIWNDFSGVSLSSLNKNKNNLKTGETLSNLRMNVISTDGGSENGFDMRVNDKPVLSRTEQIGTPAAGSKKAVAGIDNFTDNNGSAITARGHVPMNFNTDGQVAITLGTIPVEAAGGQLQIRKFDTDVGAKSIVYKCSTLPGSTWSGTLASNGTFATDSIPVPTNYNVAGVWTATYAANAGDTSVWDMSYSNYGPGAPGGIRLVR